MATTAASLQATPFRPTFVGSDAGCTAEKKLQELVHYATLAPSSHNTQCWKFQTKCSTDDQESAMISVYPDFERSCRVVDPDDHHLYVSLGCAVENLVWAAKAQGFHKVHVDSSFPKEGIHVKLSDPGTTEVTEYFEAIPHRQVTRCDYDGKPLSLAELDQLEDAAQGDGVRVVLITDRTKMDAILEQVLCANTAQLSNPDFKKELADWIRFNEKEALASGDGLYGKSFGNPSTPHTVGNIMFKLLARPSMENRKITQQVLSSAGFAVFVSEQNDPVHWVEAGRSYERFALKGTAMGVRNTMLNQPIEEQDVRPKLSSILGLKPSQRADLIVRFGRGRKMHISPRRQLKEVLIQDEE